MAAEPESDLKLEIAHILTIDVVAYSTLLIHEQSRLMSALIQAVRGTPCFQDAEAQGQLIRLPTGDGMALVFSGAPEAPVHCALQISEALKDHPEIRLRMGIHSGPVNQIPDVNDRSNVAGAGIDMAQRVMDCGDAGHILVSKRVADDLAPHLRWHRHLHDLGECEVKHGRRISLFNLYTDSIGNPALPGKLAPISAAATARRRRFIALATFAAVLVAMAIAALFFWRTPVLPRSIAVLPFLDLSQAQDQEYFSDGLTEQITNSLTKIRGLFVVARSSAFVFKNKSQDIREIGKILGVTHVVEGSVRRDPGHVRVDAQLVDVKNGFQLWAESYDLNEQNALALQTDVARKVARALEVRLRGKETAALTKLPTQNPEANDLYLRARYLLAKRTPDSITKGRALFREAVAKDPSFALGRVGIADACILLAKIGVLPAREAAALAWPEVTAALAIDEQLADAYTSRAVLLTDFEWNWAAAEADYEKALSLDPNSAAAHHWYARHLAELGRSREALEEINAAQRLDPLSGTIRVSKAKIYFVARRYDEAIEAGLKAIELEPDFGYAYSLLGQAYAHRGEAAKSIEAAKKYVALSRGTGWAQLELAYAHARAGDRAESERIVREVTAAETQFSPYDMATIRSAERDTPGALQWLERALDERSVDAIWFRVDPRLDEVRSTPGFRKILEKVNLRRANP